MDALVFGRNCVDRDGRPQQHEGELDWVGDARESFEKTGQVVKKRKN